MSSFLNEKLLPGLEKFSGFPWVLALRAGIVPTTLVTIISSIFVVIAGIPFEPYQNFIAPVKDIIAIPGNIGMGCVALIITVGISSSFAKAYKIDQMSNNAIAIFAFLLTQLEDGVLVTTNFGAKGLFLGMTVSLFTTLVNYQFRKHGWTIKMPDGVPEVVSEVFQSLIAGTVVIATVWLVTCVCGININNVITTALTPLQALLNNAWGIGLIVFLMCLLWCIGLHESLFYGFVYPVALANMALNTTAFLANEAAPTIFTQQFFGFNLWLGGSGGTLGLCILLCTSKSRSLKALGRIAAPATVFQINEPITFGVPVVFNPILAIPYCVFPAVAAVSTYYLMQFNIIGRTVAAVSLQTPPILFPYLATGGDIPATIWYCVLIVLSILMYLPFFKVYEKKRIDDEKAGAFSEID